MTRPSRSKLVGMACALGLVALAVLAWPVVVREWQDRRVERLAAEGHLVEAEAGARGLIQASPDRPKPRRLLARIVREQGRITEAEEALQRAVELGLDIDQARREHALIRSARVE